MAGSKVLVVVAHPDDEVLMCGGTIAKHVAAGDDVHVLIFTDGVWSRADATENDILERVGMLRESSRILCYRWEVLRFPDNQMDKEALLDLVKIIEYKLNKIIPSIVYTHWHGDMNLDHRIVSEATKTACRPQPGCPVKMLLMGEVPSSSEWAGGFNPNVFMDVTDTWDKKLVALQCYKEELREGNHPRSIHKIESLAQYRGGTVGVKYAEAFELVRMGP